MSVKNKFYSAIYAIGRPLVLLWHPIVLEGKENLPDRPVLLCANHSHACDPVLLCAALQQDFPIRIMAKKQLFKIPLVGAFLRKLGAFPVDRGNSDIAAVRLSIQSLRDGWSLLVFPEGTRVKEVGSVEAKGGAIMIAIRAGVDLLPVFIDRSKKPFRKVRIVIGKPYTPQYTGRKGTAEEYQANADEILRQAYALGGIQWK